MKTNTQYNRDSIYSTPTWVHDVIDRYLQGLTSVDEERALANFLKSPQGENAEFDALRAVFAYLNMGRCVHGKALSSHQHSPSKQRKAGSRLGFSLHQQVFRVAAAVTAVLVGGWMCWELFTTSLVSSTESANLTIAYVGGKPITNPDAVHRMMQESMQMVGESEEVDIVQEQLSDMFNALVEEER